MKTSSFKVFLRENQPFIIINLALTLKVLILSMLVDSTINPLSVVFATIPVLLVLSCWILAFSSFLKNILFIFFDIVLSFVLLADRMFYRFYHTVIPVPVLHETGQLGGVSASVATLFSRYDLFLFIDLPIFIVYIFVFFRKRNSKIEFPIKSKIYQVLSVFLIGSFVFLFCINNLVRTSGVNALEELYSNNIALDKVGVIGYHIIDLFEYSHNYSEEAVPLNDVNSWMNTHRQQGGSNLQGVAKGKNLIIIQLEAFQGFLINSKVDGQEVTPNLNKLVQGSMYFNNYFTQIGQGSTSDAELMSLNSLYPIPGGSAYVLKNQNTYESLPKLLKQYGYSTYAFHGNDASYYARDKMYKSEGFDTFYSKSDFKYDEAFGLGLTDESFYRQIVPHIESINSKNTPFFSFLVTLSGHHPYDIPVSKQGLKIKKGEYTPFFENYLQVQNYADKTLGEFLNKLKSDGILNNSVVVVYGDHFGPALSLDDVGKFIGSDHKLTAYENVELNRVPLVIHMPNDAYAGVNSITGGQVDLYPTLANLFGLDKNKMVYFGQDLLNTKNGFVVFPYYIPDGSFVTNNFFYIASNDGKFIDGHYYDRTTGKEVNVGKALTTYNQAQNVLKMSNAVIDTNGIPDLLPSTK